MYSLEDLKPRRKAWVKAAHINQNRVGWLLDDCTLVSEDDVADIRYWLDMVRDGKVIRSLYNKECGKGLLLWGEPGHGKTTVAMAIIQEMMTTFSLESFDVKEGKVLIRPCYFTTFNDILNLQGVTMEDVNNESANLLYAGMLGTCEDDAYNIRVLIIDDLGKEHASLSGWQKNLFHHVLRTRFNNGLPTIVTTNLELKNWKGTYGDATESFAHEAFKYLPIQTTDIRKK
jgi:DNA replication protein DnaC